jgi:hypothetical protein
MEILRGFGGLLNFTFGSVALTVVAAQIRLLDLRIAGEFRGRPSKPAMCPISVFTPESLRFFG